MSKSKLSDEERACVAENLRRIMEANSETNVSMASKMGISRQQLNNLLSLRKGTTLERLEMAAPSLGTTVEQLVSPPPPRAVRTPYGEEQAQVGIAPVDDVGCMAPAPGWAIPGGVAQYVLSAAVGNLRVGRVTSDDISPSVMRGDFLFLDVSRTVPVGTGLFLVRLDGKFQLRSATTSGQGVLLGRARDDENPVRVSADRVQLAGAVVGHFHVPQ